MACFSTAYIALLLNVTLGESDKGSLNALILKLRQRLKLSAIAPGMRPPFRTDTFDGGVTRLFPLNTSISSVSDLTVNGAT